MNHFDAVVIGAGPTGLACGIELMKRNLSVVLVEKGCIVNSIYHYPTNMTWFTTPELLEIGGIPMTSLGDKPVRVEALKYYRRVAEYFNLDIRQYESVLGIAGRDGNFAVSTRDRKGCPHTYYAKKVIVSTGFYDEPNRLNVPGGDSDKVLHYYKESHPFWNQDVLVIGAKNSAAIAALELHWAHARVTMVHRGEGISDKVKYWIKPNIENRIKAGEIKAYFNSSVAEIRPDAVRLNTPDGDVWIKNDWVLSMTGYKPNFTFLEENGVTLDEETGRPYTDPETLESVRPGLYLAGVVVAGIHTNEIFIENGRFHGEKIAAHIEDVLRYHGT